MTEDIGGQLISFMENVWTASDVTIISSVPESGFIQIRLKHCTIVHRLIFDAKKDLLHCSATLKRHHIHSLTNHVANAKDINKLFSNKVRELSEKARKFQRNRIEFFTTVEMTAFRRRSLGHFPASWYKSLLCTLRSFFRRKTWAQVELSVWALSCSSCVRFWPPWKTSFWKTWHRNGELRRRKRPPK